MQVTAQRNVEGEKRWMQPITMPPTPPSDEPSLHSLAEMHPGADSVDLSSRHRAPFVNATPSSGEKALRNEPVTRTGSPPTHRATGSAAGAAAFGRAPTSRPPFAYKSSTDIYDVKETHTGREETYRPPSPSKQLHDTFPNTLSGFISKTLSSATSTLPQFSPSTTTRRSLSLASPRAVLKELPTFLATRPLSPLPNAATGSASDASLFSLPTRTTVRFVALCTLWYLSSAMSSNTGKAILAGFRFPVTLTFIQFGYVATYCALSCYAREHLSAERIARNAAYGQKPGSGITPATQQALRGTLIMSVFQIAGHVFSSMAIARVPVSTVHTIKALSPLFTVGAYVALFGVRYSSKTYFSLLPLTFGVMLACSFDLRANAAGFFCALGSTIVFVSQNIFSKKLLPRDTSLSSAATPGQPTSRLDKLNLLLYSSGMAFVLMIPIWLYTDGGRLFGVRIPTSEIRPSTSYLIFLFTVNGTVHFAQNLLAFTILSSCSPVTYSVASLCKRIAVICIAIVSFGQHVHGVQLFGMLLTFFGLWLYNQAKHDVAKGERKRGVAGRTTPSLLPTAMAQPNGIVFAPGSPFTNPPAMLTPDPLISPTQVLRV